VGMSSAALSQSPERCRASVVLCFMLAVSFLLLNPRVASAAQVTLAWDQSNDINTSGYKVYYGTSSRNYSAGVKVGNFPTYTVTGLLEGQTYYFAVTAHDALDHESSYSNEVSANIAVACTYSLSSASQSFEANGGTGTVNMASGNGCSWAASSSVPWIRINSGLTGTGDGTVTYTVSQNISEADRASALTIGGLSCMVSQVASAETNQAVLPTLGENTANGTDIADSPPLVPSETNRGSGTDTGTGSGPSPLSVASSGSAGSGGAAGETGGSGGGGSGCFIATAAFGSCVHPHVVVLRSFRDVFLLTSRPGSAFVNWYYSISPAIANTIQKSEALKAGVRIMLIPVIGFSYLCLTMGALPALFVIILIPVAFVSKVRRVSC
jgi:hypothetical protein